MHPSGLSPHEGLPGLCVLVVRTIVEVVGRRVVVVTGGVVTRRVLVTMVEAIGPHLPERQISWPSQSFSVSHGSPGHIFYQYY